MGQKALLVPRIRPVAPGNHPFNQMFFLGISHPFAFHVTER